ncbi:energy-coupling factor ABC transporter ATP-binding protein [Spelaeicoccus albus]|nr:ABC transporter ATP-binding protein [Spelaeicoccus albus]
MIRFSAAGVRVRVDDDLRTLLHPTSLDLTERRVSVIGANGSGKSTLLRLVNGLTLPTTGSVSVDGVDTHSRGADVRRLVGFVFTDPLAQLVMPTGLEDVMLSLRRTGIRARDRRRAALDHIAAFGLGGHSEQSIYDLSGGQRQLMALASVLATAPRVLVLDEPTTLLDLTNRERFRRVLNGLHQQILFSTHDLELALDAERTLVVNSGTIAFDGAPADAVRFYRELAVTGTPS